MDNAKQHWKILKELGNDLENRVRSFLVIGGNGDGLIVVTDDGLGYWLGEMWFGWNKTKTATKPTPLDVSGQLVQMAKGDRHILLLNKRGEIYSMGKNDYGVLGLEIVNRELTYFSPQLISSPHKFISVRCGHEHNVALTDDGKCWAWGSNNWDQVDRLCSTYCLPSPSKILELDHHRVVAVECGGWHSLALTDHGEVYAWGGNEYNQLGKDRGLSTHTSTQIPTPSPVQSIAAGSCHTLLLTQTGEVWACGDNGCGQLGIPTSIKSSHRLFKVEGLPPISQIASHFANSLSIAMSSDQRCFVWGQLRNGMFTSTPRELSSFYSTVESPLSFFSINRNTPQSIQIPETPPSRLSTRMSRMFDNPETSPDVQFVVEQRTIHAHRIILSNSLDYFVRMFSEKWMAQVDPEDPIVKVTIPDHSYPVFHAFLRFLYIDCLKLHSDLLPEMFVLASLYLVPDMQQLCISRMRTTLTPTTFCLYYPLTHRHSLLPELGTFQQELVQFASTRMSEVVNSAAYHSMEPDLRDQLTNAVQNFQDHCSTNT